MNSAIDWKSALIALVLGVATAAPSARGDTIWINSGGGNTLKLDNVKITSIGQGKVVFAGGGGRESSREVQQIARIQIDDELAFSAAEEAIAGGKFDVATDGYRKALDSTAKPWLKQWAAARLVQSATRANRFDAAAAGFVALVLIDPQQAAAFKPAMPAAKSTFRATSLK